MVIVILISLKTLIFGDTIYKLAFIIPLSINKFKSKRTNYFNRNMSYSINRITYLDQIIANRFFVFLDFESYFLYFTDFIEVKKFLDKLEIDKIYVLTFELHMSEFTDDDIPVITLSKPILVTKNSSPILISKFLLNQISLADDNLELKYELILQMRLNKGAPYVLVKYNQINLF